MASTSETGHAKNVANFKDLTTRTKALGTTYNPSVPGQMQPQLENQLTEARQALTALAKAAANFSDMVDEREALYGPLPKLVTRSLNVFRSCAETKEETDTARRMADLIRGVSAKIKPKKEEKEEAANTEEEENKEKKEKKTISTSRQSYDSMYENFEKFIEVLALNTAYKPNEAELSVTGLRALLAQMEICNDSADSIETAYSDARGLRNQVLYAPKTGMVDTALAVKNYIKGILKPEHAQYAPISKLEFKRVK